MLRTLSAALALVAAATLAGCTLLQEGDGRNGDLVRIVDLSMDAAFQGDANDATDVLAAIADTRFEYTHSGADRDAGDVTVTFVDETGRERTVPLSDFTASGTLARGDKVTIGGALLTSRITIDAGSDRLASRGGATHDWLEVGGYPLPFAMRGGLAVWDVQGDLDLDAGMDVLEVVEEGVAEDYSCNEDGDCTATQTPSTSTFRISDASAVAGMDLDGLLTLDSVGTALAPALELGLEGDWAFSALVNAHLFEDGTDGDEEATDGEAGFEVDASAAGDGALRFTFDRQALQAVGGEGDLDVAGSISFWEPGTPRGAGETEDLDGFDLHTPYDEMPVFPGENPVDFVVRALLDLWAMDLAPGDEFHLASGDRFGSGLPTVSATLRVVSEGEKRVPAGTFDALRVETTSAIEVPLEGEAPERFEMPTLTTWIDTRSGVPVAIEQSLDYDYDQDDFAAVFAAAGSWDEGLTVTPPADLHIDLHGTTVAELMEWQEGFRMAPMASLLLPVAGFAAPLGSFFFAPFGYGLMGIGHASERTPDVA